MAPTAKRVANSENAITEQRDIVRLAFLNQKNDDVMPVKRFRKQPTLLEALGKSSNPSTIGNGDGEGRKGEDVSKRNTTTSSRISDTTYPCVLPGVKIKPEYCKFFKYLHHKDSSKIVVTCQLKNPADDDMLLGDTEPSLCMQQLSVDVGIYGNLKRHLKLKHKVDPDSPDTFSMGTTDASVRYNNRDERQYKFDESIIQMFAAGLPFDFVANPSFLNFVKNLDVRIKVKSRQGYIKKMRNTVKDEIKPKLEKMLRRIPAQAAHFSVDLWTNRRMVALIGIKVHFIDENWKLLVRTPYQNSTRHTPERTSKIHFGGI